MENLNTIYQSKLTTPDEAVSRFLHSGAVCASDIALAHSSTLYEAIGRAISAGKLDDITQHTLLDTSPFPFYRPEFAGKYHGVSWFSQASSRKAINAGIADVMPAYYRDIPGLMETYIQPDVLIAVVSPMDKHGYFSTGCDGSISAGILATAKTILLEVNSHMPRSLTSPQIHVSQVSALWENHTPLICLPPTKIDEVSAKIGGYIAEEIPDGSTLQLGIGAIPDAVGIALQNKHHLGIHTEMFTDSMMTLIECGAVDNSTKPIHTNKTVAAFAFGSQRMYDYIDDNTMVEMLPVSYVNDPATIAQHPNFMSINAALEVDFFGQVCAESIGTRHVSGTGGQSDYVRGAVQSKGGKSFIAFASTAKDETISRIMPTLMPGAQISTSKNDVDYIVTEYGVAKLRGRTLSQRAKALIAIAHPKFREELTFAAKKESILI
ncbi:acetyl-CoA hydrolase/transferase C-terminal domain-containing protein [Oscillibacter sp.]|uniref:acetyl-CoA hydrolase/transferase family protein n=1 Tax=Oscillibacter sp. TaxID=1945593 RepID=UPI00261A08AB|nr:acetyl-CoA hydrolase/transferase C-terminal domain-containing protein [Oscillibacter sp.]MDD3348015.1 acetyl-CoA hydrolase/transferase C-terminal domain-containing protein [Oscillibacter sp.]